MLDFAYIFCKDTYICTLNYDPQTGSYSVADMQNTPDTAIACAVLSLNCGSEAIETAIQERMMPPDRVDVGNQLALLGLSYYDTWQIFKKINGVHLGDVVWASFKSKTDGAWFWENHGLAYLGKIASP
jgi:hypothetical protein